MTQASHNVPAFPAPRRLRFLLRYAACLAWLGLFDFAGRAAGINPTTAALAFLLVVLGVATQWGLSEASFTSVAAVVLFNLHFLPPVGTLTIADPQNWIALFAFLVTALTTSQLSTRLRRRMEETRASRNELSKLYELSRALLMHESGDAIRQSLLLSPTPSAPETPPSSMLAPTTRTPSPAVRLSPIPISPASRNRANSSPPASIASCPSASAAHLVGSLAIEEAGLSAAVHRFRRQSARHQLRARRRSRSRRHRRNRPP